MLESINFYPKYSNHWKWFVFKYSEITFRLLIAPKNSFHHVRITLKFCQQNVINVFQRIVDDLYRFSRFILLHSHTQFFRCCCCRLRLVWILVAVENMLIFKIISNSTLWEITEKISVRKEKECKETRSTECDYKSSFFLKPHTHNSLVQIVSASNYHTHVVAFVDHTSHNPPKS